MRTHYDVLGVSPTASAEEIRSSYRRLVMKYHPDRHQGNPLSDLAAAELAALNQAHEVLADPQRRAAYDAELAAGRTRRGGGVPWEGGRSPGASGMGNRGSLSVVLRLLSLVVAFLLVLRFVPAVLRGLAEVWKVLAGSVAAVGGTPAVLAVVLTAVVALIVVIARRKRRKA